MYVRITYDSLQHLYLRQYDICSVVVVTVTVREKLGPSQSRFLNRYSILHLREVSGLKLNEAPISLYGPH